MSSPTSWRQVLTVGDVLREHRRSRPRHVAAVDGDVRLTYPQLDDRVNRLADALQGEGLGEGARLLWFGQNSVRLLECLLAAAKLGAIFCPANWRLQSDELAFVLHDLAPDAFIWQEEELGDVVEAARRETAPPRLSLRHDAPEAHDDSYEGFLASGSPADAERPVDDRLPLLAMYTAAFEGRPNAALLSHHSLVVQNLVIGRMQGVTEETVFLNSGPLFHIGTFMTTNAALHHGGTNVFVRRADAEAICRLVEQERCTHAFVMGPTLDQVKEVNAGRRFDLSSLWGSAEPDDYRGGIVCPPESPWAQRPGGFGQTEVIGLATFTALTAAAPGSAGRPVAAQVRVVDADGAEVPPGDAGEIVVRGPIVMDGYLDRPELNEERGRDGWHHTNDLGRREADGSITFVGPKTTMIKSAAENIYPAEVEACLRSHPAVQDVCVIGVPDEQWTQSVKAVVVAAPGAEVTADELVEHCRQRIASYKKPRIVELTDALPRNGSGFVDRAAVDAAFGGGGYPGQG